jgi:hypothetical protein
MQYCSSVLELASSMLLASEQLLRVRKHYALHTAALQSDCVSTLQLVAHYHKL